MELLSGRRLGGADLPGHSAESFIARYLKCDDAAGEQSDSDRTETAGLGPGVAATAGGHRAAQRKTQSDLLIDRGWRLQVGP
jgi:hypothetical protein